MTEQLLRKKIEKHLNSLSDKANEEIDRLAEALILKDLQLKLEQFSKSKKFDAFKIRLAKTLTNYRVNHILDNYANQLILKSISENNKELLEALMFFKPLVVNTLFQRSGKSLKWEDTPLILAVINKPIRLDLIKILVKSEWTDLDYGNFRTALDEAVALGHFEAVQILLSAGAEARQQTMQIACSMGYLEIAKELAKTNQRFVIDYDEILLNTIEQGHLDIIKYLVNDLKANVNYEVESLGKSKNTLSPLSLATQYKQADIAHFLIEKGAKGVYNAPLPDKTVKTPVSVNNLRFFNKIPNLNRQIQSNELINIISSYLDNRSKKVDETGKIKIYLHTFIPQFFQKSFMEKENAVSALTKALNGDKVDLASHLSTLRNGDLGNQLRKFIKDGHANSIVGFKVKTVREFVAALETQVNPKNSLKN
ncbi:MAG: ankyrin repeat domain-containing protein [Tatlockia sp.]|nr:ankyrin repeat domain-containing protein [Tatlockia sp.]